MTRYEIRQAKHARQCQICETLTFYRCAYVYAEHDVVTVPRCPVHLVKWATFHDIPIPKEATA